MQWTLQRKSSLKIRHKIRKSNQKTRKNKPVYNPIRPDQSSDVESNPQRPVGHNTRLRKRNREERNKPLVELNHIQYDCIECSVLLNRIICQRHNQQIHQFHCDDCADPFHKQLCQYEPDDEDTSELTYPVSDKLCKKCTESCSDLLPYYYHRRVGIDKVVSCMLCNAEFHKELELETLLNFNVKDYNDERYVCRYKTYGNPNHGSAKLEALRSQILWNCRDCATHMAEQEKNLNKFDERSGTVSFHCINCIYSFHSVMGDMVNNFDIKPECIQLGGNPYVCVACQPALLLEGGVLFRDVEHMENDVDETTLFKHYQYDPIGTKTDRGYLQGESLTNAEIQAIINDMRVDQGLRMDNLLSKQKFFCRCENCSKFSNFHNLMLPKSADYVQMLKNTGHDLEPLFQLNRCTVLWHYFYAFVNGQRGDKNYRHTPCQVKLVQNREFLLSKPRTEQNASLEPEFDKPWMEVQSDVLKPFRTNSYQNGMPIADTMNSAKRPGYHDIKHRLSTVELEKVILKIQSDEGEDFLQYCISNPKLSNFT